MKFTAERSTHVTRGADPTLVITWRSERFEISEFQGVYVGSIDRKPLDADDPGLVTVHQGLEQAYTTIQEAEEYFEDPMGSPSSYE